MTHIIQYPPLQGDGIPSEFRLYGVHGGASEDTILYSELPGRDGIVEIQFSVPDHINWWKGLEVKAPDDHVIAVVETYEGNRQPPALLFDARRRNMNGHWIRLLKAMMFGVHTARYDLRNPTLEAKAGRIMQFQWVSD